MKNKKFFSVIIGCTLIFSMFSVRKVAFGTDILTTVISKYVTDYKELPSATVDKEKTFTINFNKDINKETVNRNTIKVLDSVGREVSVGVLSRTDNNKVAQIVSPMNGYIEGENYTLVVTKGVLDIKNKPLNKEIVMNFKVSKTPVIDIPKEDPKMSEDEKFLDNLYKTNSPYWNQGLKFIDGKLNIQNYDYTGWKTLSTSFNSNINKQVIDTFKALYTEKEGYKTEVIYSEGNNNTGISVIDLYGKGLTVRGGAFVGFTFFDSVKSTEQGDVFTIAIPECTKENYNSNNYIIKNALGAALNNSYSEQIFNYIDNQYKNTVLAGNHDYIVISKTFGSFKVIVNSYNKGLYADIIKL